MSTVTDTRQTNRRNGTHLLTLACIGCRQYRWHVAPIRNGEVVGVPRPLKPHCMTCHGDWHRECATCGKCLEEWNPIDPPYRMDRAHCSNACRQKAYRQRSKLS